MPVMLRSLCISLLDRAVNKDTAGQAVETLSPGAFNMLVLQAVVLELSHHNGTVASSKVEPEVVQNKRSHESHR